MFFVLLSFFGIIICYFSSTTYFIPKEINDFFHSKFFGKASFLAFWIRSLFFFNQFLFLLVAFQKKLKSNFLFPKIILNTGHTVLLCCSICMNIAYWILLVITRNNIYPIAKLNVKMPVLPDICLHLLPLIITLIMTLKIHFSTSLSPILCIIGFSCCYSFCIFYGYYKKGEWPYSFMEKYGIKSALVLNLCLFGMAMIIYVLLRKYTLFRRRMIIMTSSGANAHKLSTKKKHFKKR
jgi:hypothetical protein